MPQNEWAKHGKASTMSGDDLQPDPPDHLLRWNENLAPHVEPFPPQTPPGEVSFDALENILQTIAQWYVRKDGKYYDVEEFGPVFSRDDVERIIVQRLKGEFPGKDLSEDVVTPLDPDLVGLATVHARQPQQAVLPAHGRHNQYVAQPFLSAT
jgi:hypothetical protein